MIDPDIMIKYQVDKGAIKFVLQGANIMCPGLTSLGGKLPDQNVPAGIPVLITAEGMEHALAIGRTVLSVEEM
jgi:PUA domain protein